LDLPGTLVCCAWRTIGTDTSPQGTTLTLRCRPAGASPHLRPTRPAVSVIPSVRDSAGMLLDDSVSDRAQTITEPESAYLQDGGPWASHNSMWAPDRPRMPLRNALKMPRLADVKLHGWPTRLRHLVAGRHVLVPSPVSSGSEEGIVAE
jgi:hypothetical protein